MRAVNHSFVVQRGPVRFGSSNAIVKGQRIRRSTVVGFRKNGKGEFEPSTDYYDVLDVTREASVEEIKASYRRLQKQYHPDISGSEELSTELNEAYKTLTDPVSRSEYDRRLGSTRNTQGILRRANSQPGLVGPLIDGDVISTDVFKTQNDSSFDQEGRKLVVWVREWAKTFVFASDLPLPLPLQCDSVEGGTRLAFITTDNGRIESVGELIFTVVSDEKAPDEWAIEVRRVSTRLNGPILGESQVLQAFKDAVRDKKMGGQEQEHRFGFELTGLAAAAFAQFMPALITLPGPRKEGASYEAYHLKHPEEDQTSTPN